VKEAFVPERSQFPLSLELALGTAKNPPPRRIGREGWEAPQGGGCVVGWVAPRRHRRRPRVVVFVVIVVPGSHSFSHNSVSIFIPYPSPETKSLILLLHEHTIHSFILMHFISH
jgi:hypothetical protein